jgi:CRP-like cAMP-binding protein
VNNITSTPLLDFAANAPLRKYPKGQILFYGGDTPTNVYLLKQGAIKVYDIDDKGNEKILHIIGRGGLFPAVFFFSKTDTSNTFYSTLTDCEVYVVPAASLIADRPSLYRLCTRSTYRKTGVAACWLLCEPSTTC